MTATLKKYLGEGGAGLDSSVGLSTLRDVLVELCNGGGGDLDGHQDTIATATIAGRLIKRACKLVGLRTSVETCGTANSTTVQVHKNGSAVSGLELTTANDEADGTKKSVALTTAVALAAGDLVEIVVSAAPTAGANLDATAEILPDITVE